VSSAPQVSVAVISYQQKPYIREALQSVIDQDYPNLQVVVSDDHSTDGTADEIRRFAEKHPGRLVPLLNEKHVGITGNSNRALAACSGKYVCLLGGDDLYLPGKVSRQVKWFEERQDRVLCGHQVEVFYEDGSPSRHFQRRLRQGTGAGPLIRYGSFCSSSAMVRADAIPAYGFDEDVPLVSDFKLFVDVLSDGGAFGYIPGISARYRRHGANVSANGLAMAEAAAGALGLIQDQYPQYAEECRRAAARLIDFQRGQFRLAQGDRMAARRDFLNAIKVEPRFLRSWLELAKTLVSA
jgi:glycosyltransferase involved in cell wall biosynthesis